MGKSERVSAAGELAVVRLVNECRDAGDDSLAWQELLVNGIRRMADGLVAAAGATPPIEWTSPSAFWGNWATRQVSVGWPSATVRDRWIGYGEDAGFISSHPATRAFFTRPESDITLTRPELVDDRVWDRSPFVNEVIRTDDFDEGLLSRIAVPALPTAYVVTVMRAAGEPKFRPRVGRLIARLQRELAPHLGRSLLLTTQPSKYGLPPQLRLTLDCLLEGDSEKQMAKRLGATTAAIHDRVKRLYRHFEVNSRAELMAYFLRRRSG